MASCQHGDMATLVNLLSFVLKTSFLPNYRIKYYDHILKCCSGIACDWFASMDIDKMFALTIMHSTDINMFIFK